MPPKKEDHPEMAMQAVQALLKNVSVDYFRELEKENARLLDDKEKTAIAQNYQEQRLVELSGRVEQEKKRADSIASDLANRNRANKDLAESNAMMKKQIKDSKEAHVGVSKKLQRLERFSAKMQPDFDIQGLDALYQKSLDFAEATFGVDFPDDIIRDGSLWKEFKNHEGSKDITFLPDNTQVAKQMRVAAALAILSRELSSSIFQGTYSMKKSTELSALLNNIADTDPEAERHLRSVLLAATPQDLYKENAEEWAWRSVESLMNIMKPPFKGSSERNKLREGLQKICDQALAIWLAAQRVEERIIYDFELDYDDDDEEYTVEILMFKHPTLSEPVSKKPQQNGTYAQTIGTQASGAGKKGQGNHGKTPLSAFVETSPAYPYVVVWPGFQTNTKPLGSARVISQAHLNEAKKESESHSKRGSRHRKRTMSKSESVGSAGGSNGDVSATSPTTSKSFLSRGAGGGHTND